VDGAPRIIDDPVIDENKSDSETERNVLMASSSSNISTTKIAEKTIPEMIDYWKKMLITETD
jgi:hypothetical protein